MLIPGSTMAFPRVLAHTLLGQTFMLREVVKFGA